MTPSDRPKRRPRRGRPLAPIPAELLEEDPSVEPSPTGAPGAPPSVWSLREYLAATHRASFNVVYVVLLLVVYEVGLLFVAEERRNAADVLLKNLFAGFGDHATTVFHGIVLVLLVFVGGRGLRRGESSFRWLVPFWIETSFYAALLSPVVVFLNVPFLGRPIAGDFLLDLGAGVYEELLFRFLLIQGMFLLIRLDPWHRVQTSGPRRPAQPPHFGAVTVIVFGAAALFSAYHHVGPGAEAFHAGIFIFRFVAGLLLSLIYLSRGLAVAVYTHASYDLLLHVLASS